MSVISENIKFLRKHHGWTQGEFAEKIGIKRSLVGAYEEGRADPRIGNLRNMAELFGVSLDMLINKVLNRLTAAELKAASSHRGTEILAITVDHNNNENIELVPQKASAGYLNGYADPEYIRELPKFQLPMLPRNATYRAFEIMGDSMLPIQPGTVVIGEYVDDLANIKNGDTYVLVTEKEGIVYKRVFNNTNEPGKLLLVSDNNNYPPYPIDLADVVEAWACKAFISSQFPDTAPRNTEMSVEQLAALVMDLQKEVVELKQSRIP